VGQVQLQGLPPGLHLLQGLEDHGPEVHGLLGSHSLGPGQEEEPLHEAPQVYGGLPGPLQGPPGRRVLLQGLLQAPHQGGQGGAELVGGVLEEAALLFQMGLQGREEPVLGPGQAVELIAAPGLGEAGFGIGPLRELQGLQGQGIQRGQSLPCKPVARAEGEEEEGQGQGDLQKAV